MFESVGMCKEASEAYLKVNGDVYLIWMYFKACKFV